MSVRVSPQRREVPVLEVFIVAGIIVVSLLVAHVVPVENIAQRTRIAIDLGFDLVCSIKNKMLVDYRLVLFLASSA